MFISIHSSPFILLQYRCLRRDQSPMAPASGLPVEFKMYYKVDFETVIRGHHVYKSVWSPVMGQVLGCKRDMRAEAQEHDSNAIGAYIISNQKETLARHVPIELSRLLKNLIEAKAGNKLSARVTGKRKREVGLVVPAKFSALTSELRIARILKNELDARSSKYTHFELKMLF